MSSNNLAITSSQNWSAGNQYEASPQSWNRGNQYEVSQTDEYGRTRPGYFVPVPLYHQPEQGGTYAPWRLFEERVRTGPYGLANFPSQPYSPFRILVPGPPERVNPRLTQFIRDSPLGIRTDWNLRWALEPEHPGLTDDDFRKAMKLLKKDVYNPTTSNAPTSPKKKSWSRSFFGTKSSSNIDITGGKAKEEKGKENYEAKNCTICLEDFVSNEQVLVTPCNHVFHNDCLVPWVKSHGKCPICRFGFLERIQRSERVLSLHNNNNNNNGGSLNDHHHHHHNNNNNNNNNRRRSLNNSHHNNNVMVSEDNNSNVDLVYLIRAMEEALNWLTVPR